MKKELEIMKARICKLEETVKLLTQSLSNALESLNSKLDHVIDSLVLLTDSQNTLMLSNQDMKAEIELTRETQREENQQTHTLLHELNKRIEIIEQGRRTGKRGRPANLIKTKEGVESD